MKSSDELREHLSAYLDGQLSGDLLEQMEATLQQDESLRAELESLRDLVDGLGRFPTVSASSDFAARVMAEVGDLDIPVSRDIAELDEVSSSESDDEMETLSVPWWLKGSIVTALAATLVLGYFVVRAPMRPAESELASVSDQGSPAASWGAPLATGLDELPDLDGLAELDALGQIAESNDVLGDSGFDAPPERPLPKASVPASAGPSQEEKRARNARADAAEPPSVPRARKATGLKEVSADSDSSTRVYEAEHEENEDGVVDGGAPAQNLESDGVAALEPEAAPEHEMGDAELQLFEGEAEDAEASELPGRSHRSGAAPIVEDTMGARVFNRGAARRSVRGSGARRDAASTAPAPAELESDEQLAVVSEEQSGELADAPSIAAKVVIGTLVVASPGVISTLSSEIRAKQWSLQNLTPLMEPGAAFPASGSQILQIMVPQGYEEDLTALLGGYGALNTDRVLTAAHDGRARLRLTVRWSN